jgi:hypothetical protein
MSPNDILHPLWYVAGISFGPSSHAQSTTCWLRSLTTRQGLGISRRCFSEKHQGIWRYFRSRSPGDHRQPPTVFVDVRHLGAVFFDGIVVWARGFPETSVGHPTKCIHTFQVYLIDCRRCMGGRLDLCARICAGG